MIPWLYSLYIAYSMTGCSDNLCYMGYTHLEASLIEVVDILFKNTIFYYSILNKIELLINDFWVLIFCMLVIIFASIF
jgi:hypothetical protein